MIPSPVLRATLLLLAIAVVALAGIWAGRRMAPAPAPAVVEPAAPVPGFAAGERFPSVRVLNEDGAARTTGELVEGRGAVVLFLDFECPPCAVMVSRWQEHLASDSLRGTRVIGITLSAPGEVRAYRDSRSVGFPIYSDTAGTFVKEHGVNDMPLCVAVDRRAIVRWSTFDPDDEIPAGDLTVWGAR